MSTVAQLIALLKSSQAKLAVCIATTTSELWSPAEEVSVTILDTQHEMEEARAMSVMDAETKYGEIEMQVRAIVDFIQLQWPSLNTARESLEGAYTDILQGVGGDHERMVAQHHIRVANEAYEEIDTAFRNIVQTCELSLKDSHRNVIEHLGTANSHSLNLREYAEKAIDAEKAAIENIDVYMRTL